MIDATASRDRVADALHECLSANLLDALPSGCDGLPFDGKELADAEAARWPNWAAPHTMSLRERWLT